MNPRELLLLKLRRSELEFTVRVREALVNVEDALRIKDINFARLLINEFVFDCRLTSTQELQLVVILLTDFFMHDDQTRLSLFFNIFEIGKNSRRSVLLKLIISALGIQSKSALNLSGTYLLDASTKEIRISTDLGRSLIQEIIYFSCNSLDKLKALPSISPMFTNALCLVAAETFKDDLPSPVIGELLITFMSYNPSPPIIFTFTIPAHIEVGSFILGALFKYTILSELYEEKPSYSKLHLKILECLSNIEITSPSKPIIYTKYLESIADHILRATKVINDPERIQKSIEKFSQLIQISKSYLYGNIPQLFEKLRTLPRNALMDLVLTK
ncbi:hypothetical protein PVAND_005415 [Polypedilum vanderplanki]|uniref:Uncharacterized protein n=1 Tax=Polypedilum vanderplanki TaxID=319348 RepID=A0A9J6C0D5_POLVA|nr:hypothetical protein PVAND_005415 [Polypedilum vanderplanki]